MKRPQINLELPTIKRQRVEKCDVVCKHCSSILSEYIDAGARKSTYISVTFGDFPSLDGILKLDSISFVIESKEIEVKLRFEVPIELSRPPLQENIIDSAIAWLSIFDIPANESLTTASDTATLSIPYETGNEVAQVICRFYGKKMGKLSFAYSTRLEEYILLWEIFPRDKDAIIVPVDLLREKADRYYRNFPEALLVIAPPEMKVRLKSHKITTVKQLRDILSGLEFASEEKIPFVPFGPKSTSDWFTIPLKTLGEGSFGNVYTSLNPESKIVVVKRIPKAKMTPWSFRREVDTLKYIQPHCRKYLLCYINFHEDDDNYYLISEYLEGYITLTEAGKQSMSRANALAIICSLLKGMDYFHKLGLSHRDIKGNNILVNLSNNQIKYIDWGLSCVGKGCFGPLPGASNYYLAPEMAAAVEGAENVYSLEDYQRADIWSLGITIFDFIFGGMSFVDAVLDILNEDDYERLPNIIVKFFPAVLETAGINDIFMRALELSPNLNTFAKALLPDVLPVLKVLINADPLARNLEFAIKSLCKEVA